MNSRRRAILAPLLAVLAFLCSLAGTASATFNDSARNPHYGNSHLAEMRANGRVNILCRFHFVGGADEEGFLGIFDFVAAVGAFDAYERNCSSR